MNGPRSIAVVGAAGCFPGATSVDVLWENIVANRTAARETPAERWRVPVTDVVELVRGSPGGPGRQPLGMPAR